jgi:MtfA peptidase
MWQKIKELFSGEEPVESVFKEEWIGMLEDNVPLYSCLPEELRPLLHERIASFVSSTRFEGCNGLELTEEMILTVAAQACMLVLHRAGEPYPELKRQNAHGVVTEGEVHRLGESWETGTVILSWSAAEHGARNIHDAENVTFHEFAHQLDHEDGATDGAPGLSSRQAYRSWARVFQENYQDFQELLERGKKTLIDPYGATNPAEFFAVVTETFFEKPKQLKKKWPELYEEMRGFYGLDPEAWGR